jgi:purine-binding chemotaxis protein CheW
MTDNYLCFSVDTVKLGIPLKYIDRVINAVAVCPLPNSPSTIHGLIDFYGTLVPVINLRNRLKLNELAINPNQIFVVVNTSVRKLILVADSVQGLMSLQTTDIVPAKSFDQDLESMDIYRSDNGIILIYDTEKFLKGEVLILPEDDVEHCTSEQSVLA